MAGLSLASVASAAVVAAVVAGPIVPNLVRAQRGSALPSSPCADTNAVMDRAVAYVEQFGRDLGSVIATEDYRQELAPVESSLPSTRHRPSRSSAAARSSPRLR